MESLNRNLRRLRRGMREREKKLRTALDALKAEVLSTRILAQRLTKAQALARLGGWEWDRGANRVSCAGETIQVCNDSGTHARHPMPGAQT